MTVCNQNRIHCVKIAEVIANCSNETGIDEEIDRNCARLKFIQTVACVHEDPDENEVEHDEVPSSVDIENKFLYLYMDIDETSRLSVGHQREEMIKYCSFKGKICPEGWVLGWNYVIDQTKEK